MAPGKKRFGLVFFCICALIGLGFLVAHADSFVLPTEGNANYSVQLVAHVLVSPPTITLEWPSEVGVTSYTVYRKNLADTSWESAVASLSGATLTYADTNVSVGSAYEYRVVKVNSSITSYGYIYSGINVPLTESRGKLILIVEQTAADTLSAELTTLTNDLIGDGWYIIRHNVASTSAVTTIKSLITSDYNADPTNVSAVFLFGHVPVPYSGSSAPDGHTGHQGAWPADVYYGDMTGTWTDTSIDTSSADSSRNYNTPGDGKFDQNFIPDTVALEVGRVDLYNMPAFAPQTEVTLLQRYLNKDHAYRIKTNAPNTQGLISDNFGSFSGEAFAASAWRDFSVLVGGANIIATTTGYFTELASTTYLWAFGAGAGSYTGADNVGTTASFNTNNPRGVFNMMFGSYFVDWDTADNFLRAPLASAGWGLVNVWSGRPHWHVHHMGLGETIGYSTRLTQNNVSTYMTNNSGNQRHIALMGDPTLRLNVVSPPSSLAASASVNTVSLSWNASVDAGVTEYYLYRATSTDATFTRATSTLITGTSVTDRRGSGDYVYMLRAVKLETTPSGSYYNASQGIFASVTVSAPNTAPTISSISDQNGPMNATTSTSVTLDDLETDSSLLALTATSSNVSIVPNANITFTGSGATRTVRIRPADHAVGTSSVSVVVGDGAGLYATSTFVFDATYIADTTAPPVPTGLSASVQSTSAINISWNASTDVGTATGDASSTAGYVLYKNSAHLATTTDISYSVTGLSAGTSYTFSVSSFDGAGNVSLVSSSVSASTQSNPSSSGGGGGGGGGSSSSPVIPVVATSTRAIVPTILKTASSSLPLNNLHQGSRGADVLVLQRFLIANKYLGSEYDTGFFGPLTQSAVDRFQRDHAVIQPIVIAPSPVVALTSVTSVTTVVAGLRMGSQGLSVLTLQRFLNDHGFTIQISGPGSPGQETDYFGPATRKAVISFQEYYAKDILEPQGLVQGTGVVGPATLKKIQDLAL